MFFHLRKKSKSQNDLGPIVRCLIIIIAILSCSGCFRFTGGVISTPSDNLKAIQFKKDIHVWREIVKNDGWTPETIDNISKWSRGYVRYAFEFEKLQTKPKENPYDLYLWDILCSDHWVTPKEFIHLKQFRGDCDDIGPFLWSVYKALDYPYIVRVAWYQAKPLGAGHVLLRIQMPSGEWKLIESTPMGGLEYVDRLLYKRVVEFDDNEIIANSNFYASDRYKAILDWQLRVKHEGLF